MHLYRPQTKLRESNVFCPQGCPQVNKFEHILDEPADVTSRGPPLYRALGPGPGPSPMYVALAPAPAPVQGPRPSPLVVKPRLAANPGDMFT